MDAGRFGFVLDGIGAVMLDKDINVWVCVLVMIAVGLLVGVWQGYWIAFIKVPPFIATLAGMYAFRGLSNVVLNVMAIGVNNTVFLNVFGGSQEAYIPDLFKNPSFNVTCFLVGIIISGNSGFVVSS